MSGALWQRLRQHGKRMGVDPRYTTELGRLQAASELSITHVVAGFQIAEIYGRFEGLNGCTRSARSPSYNASYGDGSVHDDLLDAETIEARERRTAKVNDDFDHLSGFMVTLPRDVRDAIETLCVEDRHVSPALLEPIRLFLTRITVILEERRRKKGQQHRLSPVEAKARLAAATPRSKATPKAPPAAERKINVDRVAFFQAMRALRPDLRGDEIGSAYEFFRALKDKTSHRVGQDRKRKQGAFAPPQAPPAAVNPNSDRPPLDLPGRHKETADVE
jgi:hypothetical protein